jgi:hypothetical protein
MTDDRTIDRDRTWIAEGPTHAPRRAVEAALQQVAAIDQEVGGGLAIGPLRLTRLGGVAGIAALSLIVATTALVLSSYRAPVMGPGAGATDRPSGTTIPPSARPTQGSHVGVVDPGRSFRPYEGSSAAWMAQVAACLRDKGWDATIGWDGGMHVNNPGGTTTMAALQEDTYACWDIYGGPQPFVPPTDTEIRANYDYVAHDLRDCLIGMGFDISEPPSEEEYLATYPRTEGIVESGPWTPYDDLPQDLNGHTWREVNETCPQAPPD